MFDKKSLENIELIIDNHNEVNEDALNLVSSYYLDITCLLYTSPSPRDKRQSRMPSSA